MPTARTQERSNRRHAHKPNGPDALPNVARGAGPKSVESNTSAFVTKSPKKNGAVLPKPSRL